MKKKKRKDKEREKKYQVAEVGSLSVVAVILAIVNLRGPSAPSRAANPPSGTRELPVANCSNITFSWLS